MRYSEEERKMWMDDWAKSGLSAWAYSRKNGLNLQTFLNWARPKVEENHCFVEIPANPVSLQTDKETMRTSEILIEKNRFPWPQDGNKARELTLQELQLLLAGIDFSIPAAGNTIYKSAERRIGLTTAILCCFDGYNENSQASLRAHQYLFSIV